MASAFIDIPSSISSTSVNEKLPLFQRRFGIRYEFSIRERKVTFSGDQARVDEASDELRNVMARLELCGGGARNSKSPARCHLFQAASGASSHSWQFVRTPKSVSDVNTKRFPYELVKYDKVRFPETEDADLNGSGPSLLLDFNDAYVAAAVRFVNERARNSEKLSLKAVFGRKLFRISGELCPKTEYSQRDLQAQHRNGRSLQSSWSNVCDTENPRMQALIADLRSTARQLPEHNEPSECISMHLKVSDKKDSQVVAKYVREYSGEWRLAHCEEKVGIRLVFDTSLEDEKNDNRVSFRVRVSRHADPPDSVLERVLAAVQVGEPKDASDVFATRVRCCSAPRTAGGGDSNAVEIEWVSIKTELVVPFGDLVFTLIQLKDELQLEVELPAEEDKDGQPESGGNRFSQLMNRLQTVLNKYGR